MKSKQGKKMPMPTVIYGPIYDDTRASILASSGMTEVALEDAATELEVDYDVFLADYDGPYLFDAYVGFLAMLRQWGFPFPALEISSLNGLTFAQFLLAWAWAENNFAKSCLDGDAVPHGWKRERAVESGVIGAVSAAKSLVHAKSLLASGENKIAQDVLVTPQAC